MAHLRHATSQTVTGLRDGWDVFLTAPDRFTRPEDLDGCGGTAVPGTAPGTVVSALEAAGSSALAHRSPDDFEVWYRCRFDAPAPDAPDEARLVFEGLATIADVWLNGAHVLRSENAFLRQDVEVSRLLRGENVLALRFSSLNRFLMPRRPRPRWRTRLVDHPQLRWVRTPLVGRMPGWHEWARCLHAVGPWRPVSLVVDRAVRVESSDVRASLDGGTGVVEAKIGLRLLAASAVSAASLRVGDHVSPLEIARSEDGAVSLAGTARIPDVALWWPHTHGPQPLYPVQAALTVDGRAVTLDFGRTGFRSLAVDEGGGRFSVALNGEATFLRGACWTGADSANLTGPDGGYDRLLGLAREAGMNMLRLPGTGFYESDAFYDRCAELGITLWQDFAFAVMDYPAGDPAFRESVGREADQLLHRLQINPALAVLCGNSECEAAAAMHGLSPSEWANPLFADLLPEAAGRICPHAAYVRSSQWGGALPFQVDAGVSHYYGLGAYLRPPEDVRRSGVRFATECLGFSNVPEDETVDRFLADGESPGHHPSWNAGVPRDVGLGWDFGDVRAHYAQALLGEDGGRARYSDPERYLALARVVNGELMAGAFAEWRRPGSGCGGALVWFFRDLWPCAGWGVLDSFGRPKSVYYSLKRALAPRAVFFSDEGMSGLRLHVVNERPEPLQADLRVAFFRHGHACTHDLTIPVSVGARGSLEVSVDALVGRFVDTTYAYRFGPPGHDVVVATLAGGPDEASGPASAFYFPGGLRFPRSPDLGLRAEARAWGGGRYGLTLRTERFAQSVRIEARGYEAADNYFHLEPGGERTVALSPVGPADRPPAGTVTAFNALDGVRIRVLEDRPILEDRPSLEAAP